MSLKSIIFAGIAILIASFTGFKLTKLVLTKKMESALKELKEAGNAYNEMADKPEGPQIQNFLDEALDVFRIIFPKLKKFSWEKE